MRVCAPARQGPSAPCVRNLSAHTTQMLSALSATSKLAGNYIFYICFHTFTVFYDIHKQQFYIAHTFTFFCDIQKQKFLYCTHAFTVFCRIYIAHTDLVFYSIQKKQFAEMYKTPYLPKCAKNARTNSPVFIHSRWPDLSTPQRSKTD